MATPARPPVKSAAPAKGAAPAEAEAPAPPKKKSKIILIVVALLVTVLLVASGGGAAWYFLKDGADDKAVAAADKGKIKGKDGAKDAKDAKDAKPPVFVNLEPFTVNLASEGSDRYLQTTIVLQVSDDKSAESLKAYMPVVRNHVLLLLSAKRPSDLGTGEGKQTLVAQLVATVREAVPGSTQEHGATGALFSSFVIQ